MMGLDWAAVGGILAAAGAVVTGAYAWLLRNKRDRADTRADVARSEADTVIAGANAAVYTMLLERVKTLEAEMRTVRNEASLERARSRRLLTHIYSLETLMRAAGLSVPVFVDIIPELSVGK